MMNCTPCLNRLPNNRYSSIASAISDTWNSSKQITVPLCNASGQGVERIGNALKRLQLPVRLAHKGMEMHARFGLDWNAGIETVHQKTFAASNAAPQIHAFRR